MVVDTSIKIWLRVLLSPFYLTYVIFCKQTGSSEFISSRCTIWDCGETLSEARKVYRLFSLLLMLLRDFYKWRNTLVSGSKQISLKVDGGSQFKLLDSSVISFHKKTPSLLRTINKVFCVYCRQLHWYRRLPPEVPVFSHIDP